MVHKGGNWSDQKIKALKRYMGEYNKILRDKPNSRSPFKRVYFDAFCGSGERIAEELPLFSGQQLQAFAETSPKAALETQPPFDEIRFCDLRQKNLDNLQSKLLTDGFDLSNCSFFQGDANDLVSEFCLSTDWRSTRCVMFLDPFGTNLAFSTVVKIAETKAVDMWYLFPSGLGLVRMTPENGDVPEDWAMRLTTNWGDESWKDITYQTTTEDDDLFGHKFEHTKKVATAIDYELAFIERLKPLFGGVSKQGLRLLNSKGSHMYSLIFACANPSPAAYGPAVAIADHIIKMPVR